MSENGLGRALTNDFSERWGDFLERLGSHNARLTVELKDSWRTLQETLNGQYKACAKLRASDPGAINLDSYKDVRCETARTLLHEPAKEMRQRRPYRRALMAVETHRESLERLIRSLPLMVTLSGAAADAAIDPAISGGLTRSLIRRRRRERILPLRAVVASEFQALSDALAEVEGRFFLVLALCARYVRKPWEAARAEIDAAVLGHEALAEAAERAIEGEFRTLERQGAQVLSDVQAMLESMGDQVGARILKETLWRSVREHRGSRLQTLTAPVQWDVQMRAAESEIQLEQSLETCEQEILKLVERSLEGAREELRALHDEIDAVLEWLRLSIATDSAAEFPQPRVDVIPASSRLAELESLIQAELERLPQTFETLAEFSTRRHPQGTDLRQLLPRSTIQQAFSRRGRPEVLGLLNEIESQHGAIVQQIERAREVVAFARETAGTGPEYDSRIVEEATQNVTSLLEFYGREEPEWCASAEGSLTRAIAAVYVESRVILGLKRLGIFTYLIRQGVPRALALAARRAAAGMRQYGRLAFGFTQRAVLGILIRIGWKSTPVDTGTGVVTRPFLPEEFTVDLSAKELPLLYRRLFRFEPLQDPRFLVSRETEMGAIASVRTMWEAGRPVGIILVGQRGSGKTSLINCALRRTLAEQDVVRGEFERRLVTEGEMRIFLCNLLQAGDPAQLESFLNSRRRVVILEELERTFLRQIGHYGALHGLLRVIAATNKHVLWILSTNRISFQFMNAAVDLGQAFSHRINAGTAGGEDLRRAILLRHNLSGLRLQFAAPATASRTQKLHRLLADRATSEDIFFDALSRESSGVYRSAFEIWLGQIDIVQSGTLFMKPLAAPKLSEILDRLTLDDLFTLVAIPQHGSLTAEEHAVIFQRSVAHSRAHLNGLLANEIIEPDPAHPGFRIRPEAMRIVREALYSHNLV